MKTFLQIKIVCVALSAFICGGFANAQKDTVKVTEVDIQIPTYTLGSEDVNPPFQLLNDHDVYPYTMLDDLTDDREPRTYKAIVLENEFLRATILPELGGRLYSLYDKVADREVFYCNRSIKYGLVALRGAWISGGIEFNFPNGHSTDTVSQVSHSHQANSDGSATVFVGDVDQVSEMYWQVALTLRPGTARLEQHVRLFNPTPTEHLYWYWNNAAVQATDDARFIYPMRFATPGMDAEPQSFPISNGVDLSRYSSFHEPSELFGIGVHRNFFGVYYEDTQYGVIHFADHHVVTGKKFWTWGVAGDGTIWTDLLTDADGPYNEIQAGRFETQFNRDFMPSQADESWTEYWYPVNQLDGGFVEATEQFAVNVNFKSTSGAEGEITVAVNPTEQIAHASLQVGADGKVDRTFSDLDFKAATSKTFVVRNSDIAMARKGAFVDIRDVSGRVVLHWSAAEPLDGNPDAGTASGEELPQLNRNKSRSVAQEYLNGVLEYKRGNREAAENILEELLKRDPDYLPTLRWAAMKDYHAGDFEAASKEVEKAILQDSSDVETQYDAGIIWRETGDVARSCEALWNSVRRGASPGPALIQLGEIALSRKKYASAVDLLRSALRYQADNVLAQSELAVALRLDGRTVEAAEVVSAAARATPLYPLPLAERWRLSALNSETSAQSGAAGEDWTGPGGERAQSYLEAGAWYWSLGDFDSADFIFKAAARESTSMEVSPLVYYYLASSARHRGREDEAVAYAAKARSSSLDKVFVNRKSDVKVLQESLLSNPVDARAQYLLGNYMFQKGRYAEAEKLWQQAQSLGLAYSVLSRNLGVDAWKVRKNLSEAASFYERAIELAPQDYRLYVDLDEIDAQLGATNKRAKLFADAPSGLENHDAFRVRYILFLMKKGEYDHALSLLNGHHFKPWEQGADVREIFVTAHLQKARRELSAADFADAEADIQQAFEYPTNLGVGKPYRPNDAAAHYWLGEARSEQGDVEGAKLEWQELINRSGQNDMSKYYAALALDRLGKSAESVDRLKRLADGPEDGRVGAHNYYVAAIAAHRLGRESDATKDLHIALELNPALWQADDEFDK